VLQVTFRRIELVKLHPLTISRGTSASSENLFVSVSDGVHAGVGELSPSARKGWTAESGEAQLGEFAAAGLEARSITEIWQSMRDRQIDPPAMAALDMALWDLFAKRCGQPLYRIYGLPRTTTPTSVTIGLEPPEVTRARVPEILARTGARCLKIKLGSPHGLDFDREHFETARQAAAPCGAKLRVDANGGWSVDAAREMLRWLAERGVDYVEQPLPEGAEADLPRVYANRPLPIFVDESCCFAEDVPRLVGAIDGINIKLMKCGGLTEALRLIAVARAHGLMTMIGCMSESSVAIAAGAAVAGALDHVDLDSHLNLSPDPAEGAPILDGVVAPLERPGHGARLKEV
jgi:L-alanine-DL-glutamate epimerase-like enolase superfamily enzyme